MGFLSWTKGQIVPKNTPFPYSSHMYMQYGFQTCHASIGFTLVKMHNDYFHVLVAHKIRCFLRFSFQKHAFHFKLYPLCSLAFPRSKSQAMTRWPETLDSRLLGHSTSEHELIHVINPTEFCLALKLFLYDNQIHQLLRQHYKGQTVLFNMYGNSLSWPTPTIPTVHTKAYTQESCMCPYKCCPRSK